MIEDDNQVLDCGYDQFSPGEVCVKYGEYCSAYKSSSEIKIIGQSSKVNSYGCSHLIEK